MTAKTDLNTRKFKLIARIEAVQRPEELKKLEELVDQALPGSIIKPLRKELTLAELLEEQNFKGFDRNELDQLIDSIGIEEPLEDLLAMLN